MKSGMKTIVLSIIVIAELIAMLAIWPGGVIRRDTMYTSGDAHEYVYTEPLYNGDECVQTFTALGDVLKEHSFSVRRFNELDDNFAIVYELRSGNGTVLYSTVVGKEDVMESGYRSVTLDVSLNPGEEYSFFLRIEGNEGAVSLTCTSYAEDFAPGLIHLRRNTEIYPAQSFSQFTYKQKLNIKNVIFTWLFIWIIGAVFYEVLIMLIHEEKSVGEKE